MESRSVSPQALASLRGVSSDNVRQMRFAPSRGLLGEYAELFDDRLLRIHSRSDLFWDRVVEVTPEGEEEVFDLTVPGPASWLADGVTCHNSGAIEQDSDVVMFIHREDVFNDDPAVKGLAEIIVAKHRNGPTDRVPLTFLPHLTQFRNYARPP